MRMSNVEFEDDPVSVCQLGYIGLGVSDLENWRDFACNILGLQENGTAPDNGAIFLRMDAHHHRFEISPTGEDDIIFHGWEVKDAAALKQISDRIRAYGIDVQVGTPAEAARRMVLELIKFEDPDGIATEIYHSPYLDHRPFISPRGVKSFTADSLGLGHIVLQVEKLDECLQFYTAVLGAKISDIILFQRGNSALPINFLHVNPRHHSLALGPRPPGGKRLNHFMIETGSLDEVGLALALVKEKSIPTGTLGRHTNDKMLSFYAQTPSGFRVEYGFDGLLIDDDENWQVQHYRAPSIWGHEPP